MSGAPAAPRDPSPIFPRDFLWGAATSAYQVEGSPVADGAGPSIWHRFTHQPGRIAAGDAGDVACDHYRRYREDVALMRDLGLNAYRFSASWSRVLPEGTGTVNGRGLDFYKRLVDALLEAGIAPCLTLYHWDLPAVLDERGGWLNPDIASWFAEYARVMARALGDRVALWATLNEPWVAVDAGYVHGVHPPGRRDLGDAASAARNLLLAHGEAVRAARAEAVQRIGLVVNLEPKDPASDRPEDLRTARLGDAYMNRQFLDPVLLGTEPGELAEVYGGAWGPASTEELRRIGEPLDFVGINYYTRAVVRHDPAGRPVPEGRVRQQDAIYTEMGWEVRPEAFTRVLRWVKDRYGEIPLYITENGAAFPDPPRAAEDPLPDPPRVAYLRDHLLAVREAMRYGVPVRGYFAWSLLDNLEWAEGFSKRFGIVHVDFATQRRTPKASAHFYREVIRTNGRALVPGAGPLGASPRRGDPS